MNYTPHTDEDIARMLKTIGIDSVDALFDPIPAGKYLAAIIESNMKPTKSGKGQYLELTFQILEGDFKGRKVWARLNLDNPSAQTVKIARGELSAISRAVSDPRLFPRTTPASHSRSPASSISSTP